MLLFSCGIFSAVVLFNTFVLHCGGLVELPYVSVLGLVQPVFYTRVCSEHLQEIFIITTNSAQFGLSLCGRSFCLFQTVLPSRISSLIFAPVFR